MSTNSAVVPNKRDATTHSSDSTAPTPAPDPRQIALAAEAIAEQATTRELLAWMFKFLRPVIWPAIVACTYLALQIAVEIFTTRQMGEAANHINELHPAEAATHGFWRWAFSPETQAVQMRSAVLILIGLVVAFSILRYLREVSQTKLSMGMVYYIREAVYDKLQRVGFSFHDARSTGQLINRALSDLQNVRTFVQTALLTVLEILLVVGGNILLLLTRSPWVALVAIIPLPIWVWYILRFSNRVQPVANMVMEAGDRNIGMITENIAGVHVVKAFATEQSEIGKYNQNLIDYFAKVKERVTLFANFNPVIQGVAWASQILLSFAVAVLILREKMTVGDFLILGMAMGQILNRLQQVSAINDQYQNAIISARRLYEVLMAPPTVYENPSAKPLPDGAGAVAFENVCFGYDGAKPILHDVSFNVPGGGVVAIVGPTGAGKSTLVSLIARFYDPQKGRITIDGQDIRDVSLPSLRTQVSFVFQETYLFSDTVAANIAYGKPDITGGEVEAAARLAQAHEFIETMPLKYETVLAERGSSLSGGQRQRLAIARAILTNPRVLVLDDATAAVDPETEDLIRRGMKFVMRGRTTFVIAHRLSTVKRADVVIVLDHGRVIQIGTHNELMEQEGHYREIAVAQLYGDESETDETSPSHMKRVRKLPPHLVVATDQEPEGSPASAPDPAGDTNLGPAESADNRRP